MLSLPIPDKNGSAKYSDLMFRGRLLSDIVSELGSSGKFRSGSKWRFMDAKLSCHLDPDLRSELLCRSSGWTPIFGQTGTSESHLRNHNIGQGDLFLFFGWFRHVTEKDGHLSFTGPASGFHAVYGYLRVGVTVTEAGQVLKWMSHHPHYDRIRVGSAGGDRLYVSDRDLRLLPNTNGAGTLTFAPELVLSKPDRQRTEWALPEALRGVPLSYHSDRSWRCDCFRAASRGQEFVFAQSPAVEQWATQILSSGLRDDDGPPPAVSAST